MIKLEVVNKTDYVYELKDENSKDYVLNLEFYDISEPPAIGEYIILNEKLLDPMYGGFSKSYTFGSLESKYGKHDITIDDVDVIKISGVKKEIYLKRLYG